MFNKLFGSHQKNVHCEITGTETLLEKTKVLTKINAIISLKTFQNPRVDFKERLIYSSSKPPIKFYIKIHVPQDLYATLGDLFAVVEDEDDPEQSTSIISERGLDLFMGRQLVKMVDYLKNYQLVKFPESIFFVSSNEPSNFSTKIKSCENWGMQYLSVGKKYMYKKILHTKTEKQTFGIPSILSSGFDVAVGDCSEKNRNGTGYLFATDRNFIPVNLCSNESAVDYCIKNNVLIYYNDFTNNGKLRILSKYTVSINSNLQNDYKFRSSNI